MNRKLLAVIICFCLVTLSVINYTKRVEIKAESKILGTYTTEFGLWDKPRTKNILLSAKSLDYIIIPSGGTFSFNKIVGDRTIDKGYEESTVFVYDQKVKGVGGGVCQVSTTLYNAVAYANMEILERHTHKREIFYAPKGRDATVDYPTLDFRFKNNKPYDIQIRAYTTNNKLTVEILKI